ncbi:hypothetical protein MAR_029384, partial [Mya arenaria]
GILILKHAYYIFAIECLPVCDTAPGCYADSDNIVLSLDSGGYLVLHGLPNKLHHPCRCASISIYPIPLRPRLTCGSGSIDEPPLENLFESVIEIGPARLVTLERISFAQESARDRRSPCTQKNAYLLMGLESVPMATAYLCDPWSVPRDSVLNLSHWVFLLWVRAASPMMRGTGGPSMVEMDDWQEMLDHKIVPFMVECCPIHSGMQSQPWWHVVPSMVACSPVHGYMQSAPW